jgi:8-oxo-dGTP pyrophosphatase MutT (NUDIX family)
MIRTCCLLLLLLFPLFGAQAAPSAAACVIKHQQALLLVQDRISDRYSLSGGYIDAGETPAQAALRELFEETGLDLSHVDEVGRARYVPDPRASDEAWMVTVPVRIHLGRVTELPAVRGSDDADRAEWVLADTYQDLVADLRDTYGGEVFAAHDSMLFEFLGEKPF